MSGTVARTDDGELFFIPEELHDYLTITSDDLAAAESEADDVEGFAQFRQQPAMRLGLSLPKLAQQWQNFGPDLRMPSAGSDQCSETGDSGTMGCPG